MSEQSRQNLAHAFQRAATATLVREPGDVCEISMAPGRKAGEPLPESPLLLITISSFVFRLLTIFNLSASPATRAYFARGGAECPLPEAFAEVANLCCGALNRELSAHFAHLAMSIPYTLSSQCLGFLEELQPQYLASFAITINGSVRLEATLCISCYAPMEIAAGAVAAAATAGELELF